MNTPRDRQNVEAVLQVSVKANDELYREIRRDANMCDALRELMKDDIEREVSAARKLGYSFFLLLSRILPHLLSLHDWTKSSNSCAHAALIPVSQ